MSTTATAEPAPGGLFRPESLASRQTAWLGRPSLRLGFPVASTTLLALTLAAAAAALIVFGSYTRRINLHGVIVPKAGLIKMSAPASGWLQSLRVRDGNEIEEGTVLYHLHLDTATSSGETQQTIMKALGAERNSLLEIIARKERVRAEQEQVLRDKILNLEAQIDQTAVQITAQAEFEERLQASYELARKMALRDLGNRQYVDVRQQSWMQAKDRLEELRNSQLRVRAQLIETEYQLATNDLQAGNEIGGLQAQVSRIDQQLATSEARRSIEIRAPSAGKVTAIIGRPGQVVGTGSPLLTIVPRHSTLQAELLAPSKAIGFIQPGARVLLRYSAFPYQKFGQYSGTVTDVSHAALPAEELRTLLANTTRSNETGIFYRVVVQPDRQNVTVYDRTELLPASMEVEGFVLAEGRRLYEWILEPLYGLRRNYEGA